MYDPFEHIALLAEVGSRAHGTNTADSDTDLLGVFVPPPHDVLGIGTARETINSRSAVDGEPSGPNDTDATLHSLQKFIGLLVKGNPSVLSALWGPRVQPATEIGLGLLAAREIFLTRTAVHAHLGYMLAQLSRMHTGGTAKKVSPSRMRHAVTGPDGVVFDGKHAGHVIRLGLQGLSILGGGYDVPLTQGGVSMVADARSGRLSLADIIDHSLGLVNQIDLGLVVTGLPRRVDTEVVNKVCADMHLDYWRGKPKY